jgi:hypothetical protein
MGTERAAKKQPRAFKFLQHEIIEKTTISPVDAIKTSTRNGKLSSLSLRAVMCFSTLGAQCDPPQSSQSPIRTQTFHSGHQASGGTRAWRLMTPPMP